MQIARGLGRRPNYTQEQWQQLSPEARQLFSLLPPAPPRRESYRNNGPTDVYRFYDRAGELLYVGLSCSIAARVGAHRHEHGWWSEVKWIEVEHLPSRDAAAQQEKRLIAWLVPRYNRNGGGA